MLKSTHIVGIAGVLAVLTLVAMYATGCNRPQNSGFSECDSTFTNPVMDGADPWVVKKDGYYYFSESRDGGIYISKSRKLTEPKDWTKVWQRPEEGWNSSHLWAPELHYVDGSWYVYYTAGKTGPPFITQRSGVLQGTSKDPQDPFVDKGQLYTGDDIENKTNNIWSIDLTPLQVNGRLYAIWSGWQRNRDDDATTQHLYIAEMEHPTQMTTNRVRISSPEETWERGSEVDFGINEGPEVLTHGDETFVIYSTRESWLPHYRLGQLQLKGTDSDPMKPENWIKTGPVFQGTEKVHGVGHASFTTSPDGTEYWIVYHSKKTTEPGWNRDIRMQPFAWNEDGTPNFGTPVDTGEVLQVPSGQCRD